METATTQLKYRILVIDDNTAIHDDFKKILVKEEQPQDDLHDMEALLFGDESEEISPSIFEIECASQGQEGYEMAKKAQEEGRPFAMAFVDGRMPPGWDGIETISNLWQVCPNLQVVLCTAYADYSWQEIRQVLGGSDGLLILKKPFDNVEVLQLAHALTHKWELSREIKGRLNQLAYFDHLTGLPNRTMFKDRLINALNRAQRYQHQGALLFIDLDNFKRINDTLGHNIGDDLLQVMSERLVESLRLSDTVSRPTTSETAARLGGDEFTVILPEIDNQQEAALVARRIEKHLEKPVSIGDHEFIVTASIGIALFPDDGADVETILRNADLAMYFAKSQGQGTFKYYQESMNDAALRRLTIENQLRQAIELNELSLQYQPQLDLASGKIIGLEALLRWQNSELGNVPPLELIPIAEESGLIVAIGEWVLRTACMQVQSWIDQGIDLERIAVNVSVKQFTHPDFVQMVSDILAETGLAPRHLEIEITESLLVHEPKRIASILQKLRDRQILVAVDDFGTGYSSLSRLKDMPIDCLKIDRSFVCGIEQGVNDQSIIGAIMAMANGMGLRVIAEGVDKNTQVDFLVDKNCQEAQGYLFSKPLSVQDAEEFLQSNSTELLLEETRQESK